MRLIQEFGFTVKVGHDEAHQQWMKEHGSAFAAAMPKGTSYIGTFAVVLSSEKTSGSYKTLIGLESYGAMDALAAAGKDPANAYSELLRDWSQFIDTNYAAGWSNVVLKDVNDATIWDPREG